MDTPSPKTGPARVPDDFAPALLATLELRVDAELGPLKAGVAPLMTELRQGVAALHPGPGGLHLPPQRQQEERVRLARVLDTLEDILEALQRRARASQAED
ncbi:hypothetical protein LXT21_39140 [Myxococcus sp. K38C18041901]|uniref:hypothetical protein n=1 Tax=Myxococcus guangdongensis TaxID=2906760 RepID=UPI0020A795C2|nr:hypothetical protein [Myxococcus guangdongensis]MCP3064805.1 hypothetical protein [Myxococcus guangdongensis]